MASEPAPAPLAQLADTLWLERRLLECLLFKLVEANLILTADAARFVTLAIDEVEQVKELARENARGRDESPFLCDFWYGVRELCLAVKHYRAIGGVSSAIARGAEAGEVYDREKLEFEFRVMLTKITRQASQQTETPNQEI